MESAREFLNKEFEDWRIKWHQQRKASKQK
jgi:hypothetical protein